MVLLGEDRVTVSGCETSTNLSAKDAIINVYIFSYWLHWN